MHTTETDRSGVLPVTVFWRLRRPQLVHGGTFTSRVTHLSALLQDCLSTSGSFKDHTRPQHPSHRVPVCRKTHSMFGAVMCLVWSFPTLFGKPFSLPRRQWGLVKMGVSA